MRTKAKAKVISVVTLVLALAAANPASATLCFRDSKDNGTGVPIKWVLPATGIPVYINDVLLDEGFKAAAAQAIQDAFLAYAGIACSNLTFVFQGASSSTATSNVPGAILIVFSDNSGMGSGAYYHTLETTVASEGAEVGWATIKLNTEINQGYSVGAEANKIDIQTAVMQMIAPTVGFYAGEGDPIQQNFPEIKYNYQNIELSAEQIQGVQALYFDDDGTGCTQPTLDTACLSFLPQQDGGVVGDGGNIPLADQGVQPRQDSSVTPDQGTVVGDGGTNGDDDDDGCCRVSHARRVPVSSAFLALIGLALVLVFRRRR